MGAINLSDELYSTEKKSESISNIEQIVDLIVNEFAINRAEFVNDVEKGNIPRDALDKEIIKYVDEKKLSLDGEDREALLKRVKDYLFGYHILQELIDDNSITDIKAVLENNVSIKRIKENRADREYTDIKFPSRESFRVFCNYVASRNGGPINGKNAIQVLTDKHRNDKHILRIDVTGDVINSTEAPCMAIRKIPKEKYLPDDLVKIGMFSEEMKEYFQEKIRAGAIIVLCGEGGSGKTSWMNAFLEVIPEDIHTLVAQQSEELHSKRRNIIFQRIKKKLAENDTEYTLKDLTINAMIMDIDHIIIGEIKGEEAIYLYNATYSGHSAWSSVHANSSQEALNKFVHYMKLGNTDLSRGELLEMLSSIDMVVFMKDFKCMEVTEISGFDVDNQKILFNPTFEFDLYKESFVKLNQSCDRLNKKVQYRKYKDRR